MKEVILFPEYISSCLLGRFRMGHFGHIFLYAISLFLCGLILIGAIRFILPYETASTTLSVPICALFSFVFLRAIIFLTGNFPLLSRSHGDGIYCQGTRAENAIASVPLIVFFVFFAFLGLGYFCEILVSLNMIEIKDGRRALEAFSTNILDTDTNITPKDEFSALLMLAVYCCKLSILSLVIPMFISIFLTEPNKEYEMKRILKDTAEIKGMLRATRSTSEFREL